MISEQRPLWGRDLGQNTSGNASVNRDRISKGLVRTRHVLGTTLSVAEDEEVQMYSEDVADGWCAQGT